MPKPIEQYKVDYINEAATAFFKAQQKAREEFLEAFGDPPDPMADEIYQQSLKDAELITLRELAAKFDLLVMDVGRIWRKYVPF